MLAQAGSPRLYSQATDLTRLRRRCGSALVSPHPRYLRILKCGFRKGDNAPMAFVELVDRPLHKEKVENDEPAAEKKAAKPAAEKKAAKPAAEKKAAKPAAEKK